jgi:hypothetical protein
MNSELRLSLQTRERFVPGVALEPRTNTRTELGCAELKRDAWPVCGQAEIKGEKLTLADYSTRAFDAMFAEILYRLIRIHISGAF